MALIAAPLFLAGCSGGDDDGGSATTPVPTSVPSLYEDAIGRWADESISLTLADDGTGDLELCTGHIAPANWDVSWSGDARNIDIEIGDMTRESELMYLIEGVEPGQELAATVGSGSLDLYGYLVGQPWPLNKTEPVPPDWECGGPPLQ